MTPRDWTLLVIAKAGSRSLQPVQLQKSLFLLGRNLPKEALQTESFYEFVPYDYGPFSSSVYSDAEQLESDGLVNILRPPESRYKLYSATREGAERAGVAEQSLSVSAKEYLEKVMRFVQTVPFNHLVTAIYKAYPEMKVNSVFQG